MNQQGRSQKKRQTRARDRGPGRHVGGLPRRALIGTIVVLTNIIAVIITTIIISILITTMIINTSITAFLPLLNSYYQNYRLLNSRLSCKSQADGGRPEPGRVALSPDPPPKT